jgi:hypothetical protein
MHSDSILVNSTGDIIQQQQQQYIPSAAPLSSLLSLGPLPVLPTTQGNHSMNAAQRDCIEHERLLAADHMRKLNHALAGHLAYTDIRLDLTQLSLEDSSNNNINNSAAVNSNNVHTPSKKSNNSKLLLAQSLQFTPTTPLLDVHVRNTNDQRFQHGRSGQHDAVNDDHDDVVQFSYTGDQNTPVALQQQQQQQQQQLLRHSIKSNTSGKQQAPLRLDADTSALLQQQQQQSVNETMPKLHSPIAAVTPKRSRDNYGNLLFNDVIAGNDAVHRSSAVASSLKRHSLQLQQLQQQQHTKLYKDAETSTTADKATNNTVDSKHATTTADSNVRSGSTRRSSTRALRSSSACEKCEKHHSTHSAVKKHYSSTSPTYSRRLRSRSPRRMPVTQASLAHSRKLDEHTLLKQLQHHTEHATDQQSSAAAVAQMATEIESLKRRLAQLSSANNTKAANGSNSGAGVNSGATATVDTIDWSQALLLQDRYAAHYTTKTHTVICCMRYARWICASTMC